jgi:hypothetical protein
MVDTEDKNISKPLESPAEADEKLDRHDFFKQIRNDFLVKIGLPEGTKPGQVMKMLEIKKELEKIKIKKAN